MQTPPEPQDAAYLRHLYAAAVLSGIYASHGDVLMEADRVSATVAMKAARRIAFAQADEMIRSEGEAS